MAGVAFDAMENLGTAQVSVLARKFTLRRAAFERAKNEAEAFFQSGKRLLSEEAFRALRHAVRLEQPPIPTPEAQPAIFQNYAAASGEMINARKQLNGTLLQEVNFARGQLLKLARTFLPRHLIFSAAGGRELLKTLLTDEQPNEQILSSRNCRAGERERHLLLYLQRVCTKNDSFSEFGPTGWGTADPSAAEIKFAPAPGIAARETFLERWTALLVATAVNADPVVFAELCPRLSPQGRIENAGFVFTDRGEVTPLSEEMRNLLVRCDGRTPVHALGVPNEQIRALIDQRFLECAEEVPAMDPHAFEKLLEDLKRWRPGRAREQWTAVLQPLVELPAKFAQAKKTGDRLEILNDARARLRLVGPERQTSGRALYAALNPLGEECVRDCNFVIPETLIDEVAIQAAPWIDLWRDTYAFVASRVAAGLTRIWREVPKQSGVVRFPAFLRACEAANLPLAGAGLVGLAHFAFQEVKLAFHEMIQPHANDSEYELTLADCHFVRRDFDYPKFDEYTYPSADLQLSARNMEAVNRGEYQWLLAELHPPAALLHHGAFWSCPDLAALTQAFESTVFNQPNFHFGFFPADFTAHTTIRIFDALPKLTNFVAPQRSNPKWKTVRPADAEVYLDDASGDVCLRRHDTGEHLGSFARAWLIPLGFHPFQFGFAPHTPRLRCGKVIVQRRSWSINFEELARGDFSGISTDLVLALEKLRSAKGWPRHIYIRPTEQALRRSGAEGRDKDTKPVFIDLESYLSLEIFYRWLKKAGELEVTEMFPDADHLCWQEADGRRTFELRTLIVPRG